MKCKMAWLFMAAAAVVFLFSAPTRFSGQTMPTTPHKPKPPRSVRLYVFDCGVLHNPDMGRFNLKNEDVTTSEMSMACFLIAHPKGNLIWDTGAIPDDSWTPTGSMVTQHVALPDGSKRDADVDKTLRGQLAEIGYRPADIKYLALSHYHYDHTGNANEFAGATWLVPQTERDAMFGGKTSGTVQPSTFAALQKSTTTIIKTDEYDVFGDGTVVLKSAPGHSPDHQVLFLKLVKTGPVVLSGDLYHYPEERKLNRVPTTEFNAQQTIASRATIEAFLKKTGAQLWIQHDFKANAQLKKAPEFYD